MPNRRLEDRIRTLVAHAVAACDPAEFSDAICELRAALHEHTARLRKLAATKLNPKGKNTVVGDGRTGAVSAD